MHFASLVARYSHARYVALIVQLYISYHFIANSNSYLNAAGFGTVFSVPVISRIESIGGGWVGSRRWGKASIRTQRAVLYLAVCKSRPGNLLSSAWSFWIVHECAYHIQAKDGFQFLSLNGRFSKIRSHILLALNVHV